MSCNQYKVARIFLIFTNIIFMLAGLVLVVAAIYLLLDSERVLISRVIVTGLSQPLFYYAALALIVAGLVVSSLSVLGCWATHCHNNCLLGTFLFLLVVLLVIESVVCVLTTVCPQYLSITIEREELLDTWQRCYGVPGREQYTAAVDLIQTKMQCCGVEGSNDYSITWWRLRELAAPDLQVPLSCCILQEPIRYLDPVPVNLTICQESLEETHRMGRFTEGCLSHLESWLNEQVLIGLSCIVVLIFIELLLLLFAIMMCVKIGVKLSKEKNTDRHLYNHHHHHNRDNSISSKQSFSNFIA